MSSDATASAQPMSRDSRVNLPLSLDADYALVRDLGHGGEADLLLARRRADGVQVVVRRYRQVDSALDEAVLTQLAAADRRYMIGLLGWGREARAAWEILEYAPHGSLGDLVATDRAPWPTSRVEDVLVQVTDALQYAHGLNMVHRDVKPPNILVRSTTPLDLVLTDFGLARILTATKEMRTASRTPAYAAPEAAAGTVSRALDWWSLGIIMVELLTGRNPFQRSDGSWLSDAQIWSELSTRSPNIEAVDDPRWQLLCQGLLTRDPEFRWGGVEVTQWRAGEYPAVRGERSSQLVPWPDPGPAPRPAGSGRAFVFTGRAYSDPVALAAAFRRDWTAALRVLGGDRRNTPPFFALREWLQEQGLDTAVRVMDAPGGPNRLLAQLLLQLDPGGPTEFQGKLVETRGLGELIMAVDGRNQATAIIDAIYREGILTVYDGRPNCAGFALLDDRWHYMVDVLERNLPPAAVLAPALIGGGELVIARARLLGAALAPAGTRPFAAEAAVAAGDQNALSQRWFYDLSQRWSHYLAAATPDPVLAAAYDEVLIILRPHAVELAAYQRAQQQWWDEERDRVRRDHRRHQVDRISGVLSFVLGWVAFSPGLGLFTGIGAIYFSIRARRNPPAGCLATAGLLLGIFGLISQLFALGRL